MATQPNWWESAPLVSPASDPAFTGYIPGQPKPKEPKPPVFVPQGATQMFDPNTGAYIPIPGAPNEKDALKSAIDNLGVDELLLGVKRARGQVGTGWATGTWGALAELKPGGGTPRDDFQATIEGIQGANIMEKLSILKDLSKTGASGMGALSEREGQRMAAAIAALNDQMSDKELETSFQIIERHAKALQAIRDGKDPRDPAVAKQYGIPAIEDIDARISGNPAETPPNPDPAGRLTDAAYAVDGTGGDEAKVDNSSVGVAEFTDEQKKAYEGFWKANPNPTPEQLTTFLSSIGIGNVTNAADIIQKVKEGAGYSTTRLETDYRTKVGQTVAQDRELGNEENPASLLFKQGAMLDLGDEASGVGNSLANVLTSPFTAESFDPITAYRVGRDAERMRIEDARQQLGYGGTALEFGGALASLSPGAVSMLAPREAARQAGRAGFAGGALSGFGSGEGAGESLAGAVTGSALGYVTGRYGQDALSFAGRALPRRFRGPRGMNPELAAAADTEGVDLIRPMVDLRSRAEFGALESDPAAQHILREGMERTRGQIEGRVADLGSGGTALEPDAAGDVIQRAGNRFITRSRDIKNRLYARAENLGGAAPIQTSDAVAQIDNELAQLSSAPDTNAAEIRFLEGLRNDLSRPQTVASLRRIRTSLRGQINQANLTMTSAEARALRVMDAARNDIMRDAPPAAANAYARADAFNRERQVYIDDVLRHFLGKRDQPKSAEEALKKIKSMASPGGDGRRLAAIMRNLEADERQDVAATIAQHLGRSAPDQPFSLGRFLEMTKQLSPSARRTIFGPDGAQSIDNLRTLSRALIDAGGDINRSRSTTVANRMSPLKSAARGFIASLTGLAGLGGYAAADVGGAIAGATAATGLMAAQGARRALSARAMVNPRVSRWLAEAANVSTQRQAQEAARKLGVIIAREPALAVELQPIYETLQQRLALPLAADSQPKGNDDDR